MLEKILKIIRSIDTSISFKELKVCRRMIDNLEKHEEFKNSPIIGELRSYCISKDLVISSFVN